LFIPPDNIWIWRATIEWYWQGWTEYLGEKPIPVPLCPPQTPHGLTRTWTRACVSGWWLTAWAIARPQRMMARVHVIGILFGCQSQTSCIQRTSAPAFSCVSGMGYARLCEAQLTVGTVISFTLSPDTRLPKCTHNASRPVVRSNIAEWSAFIRSV
jgi:hypothetical protein